MYNYFIQTKKKVHKFPETMQWMDGDQFAQFLISVRQSDQSKYVKSWRSKVKKKGKKNGNK